MKAYCILHIPTGEYIYGEISVQLKNVNIITPDNIATHPFTNFYLDSSRPNVRYIRKLIYSDRDWLKEYLPKSSLCSHIAMDFFPGEALEDIDKNKYPTINEFELVEIDI